MGAPPQSELTAQERQDMLKIWEVIAARRVSYHSAVWQTPALSLTAQAFLLTIALGADTAALSRILAAGVALLAAVVTMQLLVRHRKMELLDWLTLEQLERDLGFDRMIGVLPHARLEQRYHETSQARAAKVLRPITRWAPGWFWNGLSLHAWALAQLAFVLVSAAVIVIALAGAGGWLG